MQAKCRNLGARFNDPCPRFRYPLVTQRSITTSNPPVGDLVAGVRVCVYASALEILSHRLPGALSHYLLSPDSATFSRIGKDHWQSA